MSIMTHNPKTNHKNRKKRSSTQDQSKAKTRYPAPHQARLHLKYTNRHLSGGINISTKWDTRVLKLRNWKLLKSPDVVGSLESRKTTSDPPIERSVITLDNVTWVGRDPECHVVIQGARISARHFRIYAYRTAASHSITILHDTSTNGFTLNGGSSWLREVRVGDRQIRSDCVVLRDGDVIRIPGYDGVFIYRHQPHHAQRKQPPADAPDDMMFALSDTDTSFTRNIGMWDMENLLLGCGSFGSVHLATHRDSGTHVVVKTVSYSHEEKHKSELLQKEIGMLKKMDHPNVLALLDTVQELDTVPKRVHLVMELQAGGDLFSYKDQYAPLREDETRWIAWQLVDGLKYLHNQQVAHRDIKPENIFLRYTSAYPHITIGDLGSATTRAQLEDLLPSSRKSITTTRPFQQDGTVKYQCFEQAVQAFNHYTSRQCTCYNGTPEELAQQWMEEDMAADSWAVGVTLFQCATHEHPYWDLGRTESTSRAYEFVCEEAEALQQIELFEERKEEVFSTMEDEWSQGGISFLNDLLEYNQKDRMGMISASEEEWFKNPEAKTQIQEIRNKVIERGEIYHGLL